MPEQLPDEPGGDLGALLRSWRQVRGLSQLELSLEAGVSQRHLSFLESGRSMPSRRMLDRLAGALGVPLRDRNALRLAAGFAPSHAEGAWDGPEMEVVTGALRRMLAHQEPFPAVVLDRAWNVVLSNAAAPRLFGAFVDLEARAKPRNLLHLMFDPQGMRPFVRDWPTASAALLARVRHEATGGVIDADVRALIDALLAYPDVEPGPPGSCAGSDRLPVVPLSFVLDGVALNYFSLITTVAAPRTATAQELRLECMFPADEATEVRHLERFGPDRA